MAEGGEKDYLLVLQALSELPFGVGRNLLISVLRGTHDHDSVRRNGLERLTSFGSMAYAEDELHRMLDSLLVNGLVQSVPVHGNRYLKVLELTAKGKEELAHPSLYKRRLAHRFRAMDTTITGQERTAFAALASFFPGFTDEQKKAVISRKSHVLCIAGAGSGKTTVLAKRIEFLLQYRSVPVERILAVTFTRKARQEMEKRLGGTGVQVETFNSFCEGILRKHADVLYGRPVRVVTFRDRMAMVGKALNARGISLKQAISTYFTPAQQRSKTEEQLAAIFVSDCFFIRDYFKCKGKALEQDAFELVDAEHQQAAEMVYVVCSFIGSYMQKHGLRDFADQLIDALALFTKQPDVVPQYEHVLIDEFQDVNAAQMQLVGMLAPPNLFCVGDPRQSIYGWRGSDIKFILSFEEQYPDCEIVTLTTNYRSSPPIVSLVNKCLADMKLPDLVSGKQAEGDLRLLHFDTEAAEFEFVVQRILSADIPRSDIFVLARTNRQLNELSAVFRQREIPHVVRSDELRKNTVAGKHDATLATIHAIKGMEAEMVFVIGCSTLFFPCKGSEHPVLDMVAVEEYDKEEEERRLFYVALSRARKYLYLSYTGRKPTTFLAQPMLDLLQLKQQKKLAASPSVKVVARLKEWRRDLCEQHSIPAYLILTDRTILDIAQKLPMTEAELQDIHGLGPSKIMRYGEDILRLVSG